MTATSYDHTRRLGDLHRTRKWQDVVGLLEGGAGAAQIANATISAAEKGFNLVAKDAGLIETIYLLTQLPLAARSDDLAASLRETGLDVGDSPTLMEVIGAFSDAVDRRVGENGGRTDLGEMAQMAAAETLNRVIGERTHSIFGTTPDNVKRELGRLATNRQFGIFSRQFFGRLTERCLDYLLSRAMAHHVGEDRRFATLKQQGEFTKELGLHCYEAAKIVEEFSGGWFSKASRRKGGITRKEASRFAHVAMQKIEAELKQGGPPDAE